MDGGGGGGGRGEERERGVRWMGWGGGRGGGVDVMSGNSDVVEAVQTDLPFEIRIYSSGFVSSLFSFITAALKSC